MHDGWVSPPEGPGLGVEVDESVVRSYRFAEDDLDA
jgi:L-alanine-DL-glutamate epimerase-like enolase superfamily enzyme